MNAVRPYLAALRMLLVLTVVLGLGYPLVATGLAQLLRPDQANGSLVSVGTESSDRAARAELQ